MTSFVNLCRMLTYKITTGLPGNSQIIVVLQIQLLLTCSYVCDISS